MASKKGMYSVFKNIIKKENVLFQSKPQEKFLESQIVNLMPIFDTMTQEFSGVIHQSLVDASCDQIIQHVQDGLKNIAYWHCHGRAINTLLPIHQKNLSNELLLEQLISQIASSSLPIGLVKMPIIGLQEPTNKNLTASLLKLQRLGIIFEFWGFNGSEQEFAWLKQELFLGVHLSIGLLRAVSMTTHTKEIYHQLTTLISNQKIHTYSGGISLVHDLTFARNMKLNFCYGTLLMPSVTKHQILKINDSQFAHLSVNKKPHSSTNGERKLC
jgi:EAL domain-containing protein (putative c-di-GMP-specific phosphodiesterase class I)